MARKLTTFELEPQKKPPKAPKKKKTLKQRLPIIVPFAVIFLVVCIVIIFLYVNASKVNNTSITIQGNDIPISTAEIVNTGFSAAIPDNGAMPTRIDSAAVGDTVSAFCEVGAYNDVAATLTVAWMLPDGTQSGVETVAVTGDGYYYATMNAAAEGVYQVSWTLDGQRSATAKLTVAAAQEEDGAEGGNNAPEANLGRVG